MLVWLSWGDALSKQFGELFVAKADKCYARSLEEPLAYRHLYFFKLYAGV